MKKTDDELEIGGEEPDGSDAETDPGVHLVNPEADQGPRKQGHDTVRGSNFQHKKESMIRKPLMQYRT